MGMEEALTYVVAVAVPVWLVVEQVLIRRRSANAHQLTVARHETSTKRAAPLAELPRKAA